MEITEGTIWSPGSTDEVAYVHDGSEWVPVDSELLGPGFLIPDIPLSEDESFTHEIVFAEDGGITAVPINAPRGWSWVLTPVFGDDSAWVLRRARRIQA